MNSMVNYKSKELETMKVIKDILMGLVVLYHRDILIHGSECSVTDERMDEVRKIGSLISEVRKLLEDKREGTVEWEMTIKKLYDLGNQL